MILVEPYPLPAHHRRAAETAGEPGPTEISRAYCGGTADRSRMATSTGATRSATTRRSSAQCRAVPKCPRPAGLSRTHSSPPWSLEGIAVLPITLHTGVSSQEAGEAPQPEWFECLEHRTPGRGDPRWGRPGGGRWHDSHARLESAVADDGRLEGRSGWTERVVTPAEPPRVVTGLVTGWHDPQASHLLLVEAVAGRDLTQQAYDEAVRRLSEHEFGDAALILPGM